MKYSPNNQSNRLAQALMLAVIVLVAVVFYLVVRQANSKPIPLTCTTPGLTYEEALKHPELDKDGTNGPCEEQFGIFGNKVKKKQ